MKTDQIRKQIDDALDELGTQLDKGRSEQLIAYLAAMARFHSYSWGNTCPSDQSSQECHQ